jgi:hypothetical protein
LQQRAEKMPQIFFAEFGETLGAVAALQQECFAVTASANSRFSARDSFGEASGGSERSSPSTVFNLSASLYIGCCLIGSAPAIGVPCLHKGADYKIFQYVWQGNVIAVSQQAKNLLSRPACL